MANIFIEIIPELQFEFNFFIYKVYILVCGSGVWSLLSSFS